MRGRRQTLRHVAAFDDAPFERGHRGDVPVVGTVFSGLRLDGILWTKVRRDGAGATRALADVLQDSRFFPQIQVVLLQGITLAGFNVVDIHGLSRAIDRPVLVVTRRAPNLDAIRRALQTRVPGGARKWKLIEAAGPMEPLGRVHIQRVGLDRREAARLVEALSVYSDVPEPLRTAHIVAGSLTPYGGRRRV